MKHDAVVNRLRERLATLANGSGWGYQAGKASRIEPTCWALLALHGAADPAGEPLAIQPHFEFLTRLQDPSGLLVETEPNLANMASNGLALILLTTNREIVASDSVRRLARGMLNEKGVSLPQLREPGLNSALQGWSWVRGTFSWVEPTAWCLLAFKTTPAGLADAETTRQRCLEAEQVLLDRVCRGGGWNYGNASALGQDLRAYVPTTAVGLLAMQDRSADPAVRKSLAFLNEHRGAEGGAMTLSLVSICLRLFGVPAEDVDDRLSLSVETSLQSENIQAMAMALFALTADRHHLGAFRVPA